MTKITGINTKVTMNDGKTIPIFGLGVFESTDGRECRTAVETALETGYRHIDTATVYRNEKSVGRAINESRIPRSDIFLTTKLMVAKSAENATDELKKSLDLLKTDYVNLYLIHWPVGDYMRAWELLQELRDQGLCRSIGVSNYTVKRFDKDFFTATDVLPAVNQMEMHCFNQRRDLHTYCTGKGILMEAYSPLARAKRLDDPVLTRVSGESGKSPAQVMIRYLLQKGVVTIPKSSNPVRIKENAQVFDFELSQAQMALVDSLNDDNYYSLSWRPEGFY